MKKLSTLLIGIYAIVTVLTVAATVVYIAKQYVIGQETFDGICLFPLFLLIAAEVAGHTWWKNNQTRQRCKEFVVGKIVGRRYVHNGNQGGYAPVVRFEADGEAYTVEVNLISKSAGRSTNCTVGDEYYLLYNSENPREIIPCSSGFDDFQKFLKIATIVLHAVYVFAIMILMVSIF